MFHAIAVIPIMTTPITAVFAFQLAGCAYHPPAGDQTCLGYGIFPPVAWEIEAPFDSTDLIE